MAPGAGLTRCPRHPRFAARPAWHAHTVTWLRAAGEDAPLLLRHHRLWHQVETLPPEDALCWPGTLPAECGVEADPAAIPIARFTGRRAVLAEGVIWLEGRIEAAGQKQRIARLFLEGDTQKVLALGAELAASLPLLPAAFGLSEVALALAETRPPPGHAAADRPTWPAPRRSKAPSVRRWRIWWM